ncbi:MAG TPA: AbrB/MazE/SpoVT family DNA-binding domain-containing protein [Candidatus Acidoferrales bacterium]|nr:AbrB/MazE/SpoVT family DNA-binding domain-containing protein [Candidatus Acidoferrales bacterium]
MAEAIVSSKYQIVIPREARKALGLKPGDKLLVILHGDNIIILQKPKSYRKAISGIARGLYPPNYLKKERESWE